MIRLGFRIAVVVLVAAGLGACKARTDRALYGAGDAGTTFLENGSRETVSVGCTIHIDRVEDGVWETRDKQLLDLCRFVFFDALDPVFASLAAAETFASVEVEAGAELLATGALFFPVPGEEFESLALSPGGAIHSGFTTPAEPGRYRIRYSVGFGCSDATLSLASGAGPLGHCLLDHPVETPPFHVEERCAPEECLEEPPVCKLPPLPRPIPFPIPLPGIDPVLFQSVEPLPGTELTTSLVFEPDILIGVPILPPEPTPDCRRSLADDLCRWVCDDSRPTPPPHGY